MKGYEEFKGYQTRLDFDPKTKTFSAVKVAKAKPTYLPIKKKRKIKKAKKPKQILSTSQTSITL
jgi:hypothetical protein